MSYRTPPIALPNFYDAATKSMITIDNGTISYVHIPCFYRTYDHKIDHSHDRHGRMHHDHDGWPSPDNPDGSCQAIPHRHHHHKHISIEGINLVNEGYTDIEMSFTNPPDGLSAVGSIDYDTVVVAITSMCVDAIEKDVDVPFCIYAKGQTIGYPGFEESRQLCDVITKGVLHIIAGPFNVEGE